MKVKLDESMTSLKLEIQITRWMWYWFVVEPKRLNAIVWLCECVRDFNVRIHFYLFRKWTSVTTLCTVSVSLVVVCRRYLLLTCSHTYIFSVEKRVNVTFVYQHRHLHTLVMFTFKPHWFIIFAMLAHTNGSSDKVFCHVYVLHMLSPGRYRYFFIYVYQFAVFHS